MPHELFLTTSQTTTIRNSFANNMSIDIKLSKAKISKIIQSGGSFGSWLGNLGKKALTNTAIPWTTDNLPGLVSNLTSSAINKFDRKISEKGAARLGKGFTLFILNEDMVYMFFYKKTGSGISVNEQLAEELHKSVTKRFKRRKVHARFKGNIWAADLAEMDSLSSTNKSVKYLLCVIDVFAKYAWVKALKDKR